jgi:hypothetical protein
MAVKPRFYGIEILHTGAKGWLRNQLTSPKTTQPPIQLRRHVRNGTHPNALLASQMNEAANMAAMFRTKQSWAMPDHTGLALPLSQLADRVRARWAFHTGPMTHQLLAMFVMYPPNEVASGVAGANGADTYARCDILNGAGATIATDDFHYGPGPAGSAVDAFGWPNVKVITKYLAVSPITDYYGVLTDKNYGRIQSACIFEIPSMTTNNSGYLSENIAERAPIADAYRENLLPLPYLQWRRGGCMQVNWSVADGAAPITNATTTPTNVVDNTSTAISAATPGYTLDMSYRDRLSETTGVPCAMKVYASRTASNGTVTLKDSAGATIATVTVTGAIGWYSTTFNMPATADKYDIHYTAGAAGTITLHAVSIYEYAT